MLKLERCIRGIQFATFEARWRSSLAGIGSGPRDIEAERLPAHDERQSGTRLGFEIDGWSNQRFDEEVVSLPKSQAHISTSQSLKLLDARLLARGEQALRRSESFKSFHRDNSKYTMVPKAW